MKKLAIIIVFIAILVASYEMAKDQPNIYITCVAVIVFMFGMMRLSSKTPSKNPPKDEEDV
ncbi:MAG TPA: hypothetical protein VGB50_10925 [Flavobacterium sp.]|jgi:hypothetical protein